MDVPLTSVTAYASVYYAYVSVPWFFWTMYLTAPATMAYILKRNGRSTKQEQMCSGPESPLSKRKTHAHYFTVHHYHKLPVGDITPGTSELVQYKEEKTN